jgi:hypothetical protein
MTIPGTAVTAHGLWVYDGLMNTPPGGPTGLPKCANCPPNL